LNYSRLESILFRAFRAFRVVSWFAFLKSDEA